MRSNIHAIRQRKADMVKKQRALLDTAAAENRSLTEPEGAQFEENIKTLTSIEQQLTQEERVLEAERSMDSHVDHNTVAADQHAPDKPGERPFKSLGEQLCAVARSSMGNHRIDPRLVQAAASGMNEASPSEGGFLVQTDFAQGLLKRTYELGEVSKRVFKVPIGANSNGVKLNAIDEDSRVDGSRWGGVLAYWQNEADTKVATKPKFRQIQLQLQKLTGLCYATDELLQDAAALEAVIQETFPQEFNFKVEDAIINGTGAGQPLGIMNSGAVISVAENATGVSISTTDVLNMWARMWAGSRKNAVWLINQDVEPALYALTLGSGTAVQLLYTPPGGRGNEGGQYGLLLGRPVIPVEYCATLGTPGDIILCDLTQYLMADKGGIQTASSIHVRFLNDETTFRFVMRLDGQPAWKKALTPKNGSSTLSPFIVLAVRT